MIVKSDSTSVRVDSWKTHSTPKPKARARESADARSHAAPAREQGAGPFAKEDVRELDQIRADAARVPDLVERALRAESHETRIVAHVERERRERAAIAIVALILGVALTGWRLHIADEAVTEAREELRRVSLERDSARTHVAGLRAEANVLRESLRDEENDVAELRGEVQSLSMELASGERAARAFGEAIARLVDGK